MTTEVIRGHNFSNHFSLDIFLYLKCNIIKTLDGYQHYKTQFFHKIKYDLKGHMKHIHLWTDFDGNLFECQHYKIFIKWGRHWRPPNVTFLLTILKFNINTKYECKYFENAHFYKMKYDSKANFMLFILYMILLSIKQKIIVN